MSFRIVKLCNQNSQLESSPVPPSLSSMTTGTNLSKMGCKYLTNTHCKQWHLKVCVHCKSCIELRWVLKCQTKILQNKGGSRTRWAVLISDMKLVSRLCWHGSTHHSLDWVISFISLGFISSVPALVRPQAGSVNLSHCPTWYHILLHSSEHLA